MSSARDAGHFPGARSEASGAVDVVARLALGDRADMERSGAKIVAPAKGACGGAQAL